MPYHTQPHPSFVDFHSFLVSSPDYSLNKTLIPYSNLIKPLSTFLLTTCELGTPQVNDIGATPVSVLKLAFESWLCSYLTNLYTFPASLQSMNKNRQGFRRHPISTLPYDESPDGPVNFPDRVFQALLSTTLNSQDFLSGYRSTVTCLSTSPTLRASLYPSLAPVNPSKLNPMKWNAATIHLMDRYRPEIVRIGTIRSQAVLNLSLPHVAVSERVETPLTHEFDKTVASLFPVGFTTRLGDFTSLHRTPFNPYKAIETVIPPNVVARVVTEKNSLQHAMEIRMKRIRADHATTLSLLTTRGSWSAADPYTFRADRAGEA